MSTLRQRRCGRKIIFLSEEAARRQAKGMHKLYKAHFTAYHCQFCNGWHIGRDRSYYQARKRDCKVA